MIREYLKKDKNNIWWLISFYVIGFFATIIFMSLPSFIEKIILGIF